ncbi:hypothetical protein ACQ856_18195 [Mycolicibacterium psychrotolerans]|uniref:hypothetical protein n=1 Tax=Mycolicibacterium psychrotolerans TaxID=216929 RepID=UPI003D67E84C
MKALTVRQPWAALILHGGKNIENRRRNIVGNYRGEIAIHAALTDDPAGFAQYPRMRMRRPALVHGAILGIVDVIGVHRAGECPGGNRGRCDPWGEDIDGVHIELAWPRPIAEPIPCRGFLGLWTLDDATTLRTAKALAEAVRR